MSQRFILTAPIQDGRTWLEEAEAHHLMQVMRAGPGDEVTLFDGAGREFTARIEQCQRRRVTLSIVAEVVVDRELSRPLEIAVALPKGDRQRWLVEKCVELGVSSLTPLFSERGVARPLGNTIARLERAVIEACKQCGRNRLMEIAEPRSSIEYLASVAGDHRRLVAHPGGEPVDLLQMTPQSGGWSIAVGPEGGWTDEELRVAVQNDWRIVGLGPRILRVETAAIALAAITSAASEQAGR